MIVIKTDHTVGHKKTPIIFSKRLAFLLHDNSNTFLSNFWVKELIGIETEDYFQTNKYETLTSKILGYNQIFTQQKLIALRAFFVKQDENK